MQMVLQTNGLTNKGKIKCYLISTITTVHFPTLFTHVFFIRRKKAYLNFKN